MNQIRLIQRNAFQFLRLTVMWFLLTVLITPIAVAEPIKSPRPFKRQPLINRDPCDYPKLYYCTEPTKVRIGHYTLMIPYHLIRQWPPGERFIELMPRWPGMTGTLRDEKYTSDGAFDLVRILIHTERPQRPSEEGIRYQIQFQRLSPPIPLPEIGLFEYRNPRANNRVSAYIPIDQTGLLPAGQPLYIHTGGPALGGDMNKIQCQFGYTVRDSLYVTVRFYTRHLGEWKSITTSVRDLVESFLQE